MLQNQELNITESINANAIIKVRQGKSLILRPGGNISIFPSIFVNQLIPSSQCELYINQKEHISIPANMDEFKSFGHVKYEGQLDETTFLPEGNGLLCFSNDVIFRGNFKEGFADGICKVDYRIKPEIEKQYTYKWGWRHGKFEEKLQNFQICGYYINNLLQGELTYVDNEGNQIKQLYHNGIQVNYLYQESINQMFSQTTRYLFENKEFSINNYLYLGLNGQNWLNQLIVDYYLELIKDYYKYYNQDKEILLINTITSQDIFSSFVRDKNSPLTIPENIKELIEKNNYNRILIVLNADRSHFVTLVYQDKVLYLLNSQNGGDQDILDKVAQLFNQIEKKQVLQVPQQQNGHDCGLYTIFNALLQYKNIDKHVENIDYTITTPEKIRQLRHHLKNIFINDFSHIIPIYN